MLEIDDATTKGQATGMRFITDAAALQHGQKYLSAEEFAAFTEHMKRMRHFDDCLGTNTPSNLCTYTDPTKNLEWRRLGLHIETVNFEALLGEILARMMPEEQREATERDWQHLLAQWLLQRARSSLPVSSGVAAASIVKRGRSDDDEVP